MIFLRKTVQIFSNQYCQTFSFKKLTCCLNKKRKSTILISNTQLLKLKAIKRRCEGFKKNIKSIKRSRKSSLKRIFRFIVSYPTLWAYLQVNTFTIGSPISFVTTLTSFNQMNFDALSRLKRLCMCNLLICSS